LEEPLISANGAPDLYERRRAVLDLQYSRTFHGHRKSELRERNLPGTEVDIAPADKVWRSFSLGREYMAAIERLF